MTAAIVAAVSFSAAPGTAYAQRAHDGGHRGGGGWHSGGGGGWHGGGHWGGHRGGGWGGAGIGLGILGGALAGAAIASAANPYYYGYPYSYGYPYAYDYGYPYDPYSYGAYSPY